MATNQRTPAGEIDIICRHPADDGSQVVIVEVKARSGQGCGTALEAVGPRKARRLRAAALWWLAEGGLLPCRVRFDVVAVSLDHQGLPCSLEHLKDAIEGGS